MESWRRSVAGLLPALGMQQLSRDRFMSTKVLHIIATVAVSFASYAHADCAFPKAPASIPDGKTASEQDMVAAMTAFKAYNEEVNTFGQCLDQETKDKAAGTAQLMQLKTMQTKKLKTAMDELQAKAKQFNEQVRIFKAR
jgi:predicted  nucleic acid-binding Zn-ribbon protein